MASEFGRLLAAGTVANSLTVEAGTSQSPVYSSLVSLEPVFAVFDPAQTFIPADRGRRANAHRPYAWSVKGLILPVIEKVDWATAQGAIAATAGITGPVSLECYLDRRSATFLVGAPPSQIDSVAGVWQAVYPDCAITSTPDPWADMKGTISVLCDWYSPGSYHRCIRSAGSLWPHVFGLSFQLDDDDIVFVQIFWQPVRHSWQKNIGGILEAERSLGHRAPHGNAPSKSLDEPLFAACMRVGTTKPELGSRIEALVGLFSVDGVPLRSRTLENFLAVVSMDDVRAMLRERTTFTTGNILTSSELAQFAHLPNQAAASIIHLDIVTGLDVPERLQGPGIFLGTNDTRGISLQVFEPRNRNRNCWYIGRSRSGKTTGIIQKCVALAKQGQGVGLIDPHREAAFKLLGALDGIAPERVVFLDYDAALPVAYNAFIHDDEHDYGRIATEYVGSFQHLLDQAGYHRTLHIFGNAIYGQLVLKRNLAVLPILLEKTPEGARLRQEIVANAKNESVRRFFLEDFSHFGPEAMAPIINRFSALFLDDRTYRVFAQDENRINIAQIMDEQKILIVAPPASPEAAKIVGGLLIAQAKHAAFRRAGTDRAGHHFHLVIDEVQRFVSSTNTLQVVLDEASKGGLSVSLANQETGQLPSDFLKALYSVNNIFVFDVNLPDARQLSHLFNGRVMPEALASQRVGHVYARIGQDATSFQCPPPAPSAGAAARIIEHSQQHYYASTRPAEAPSRRARVIETFEEEP